MDRESLKKSGLLEQYVLGLTNRKESMIVERAMEEDPEVLKDYELLRDELEEYVGKNGMSVPEDGRPKRTSRDFEELDHEMVLMMTERAHSLQIWRYVLGTVCLLLLCLSGYLFRLNENNRHATITEKAMHAQDNNNHEMVVKSLLEKKDKWTELKVISVLTEKGTLLVHVLEAQEMALLDFSHLSPLAEGSGYFVYFEGNEGAPGLIVPAGQESGLRTVALHNLREKLTIYHRALEVGKNNSFPPAEEHPIVTFPLAERVIGAE